MKYSLAILMFCVALPCQAFSQSNSGPDQFSQTSYAARALYENSSAPPAPNVAPTAKPLKADAKPASPKIAKRGVVDFDIYRDRNPYPVDPRKPCSICTQRQNDPPCNAKQARKLRKRNRIYGFQGRPYQEQEPGACLCGKKKKHFKWPNINVYWPTMFAGVPEEHCPTKSAIKAATFDRVRLVDAYDRLGGFEVSSYQRKDNGHCGCGRERYGCLGESRQFESRVSGVGFREPGQPVERGGISFPLR